MSRVLARGLERWCDVWRGGLRPRSIPAFAFAIVCVAAAAAVRIGLGLVSPESAVFASFYSATLVSALVGGAAVGGFAASLGAIVAYALFVPPEWSIPGFELAQLISCVLYVASSVVIIWAAESYRALLQRLRDEERARALLNRELAHRMKNTLATVQAIVNQSLADYPEVCRTVGDRISALATTHDVLIESDGRGASLRQILSSELAPYGSSRVRMAGRDVVFPSSVAGLLNLAFHELATNAAKYGAFSVPAGRVAIAWTISDARLDLEWTESGGPVPCPPTRSGFGTRLLRYAGRHFDGTVETAFSPTGLQCRLSMRLPKESIVAPALSVVHDAPGQASPQPFDMPVPDRRPSGHSRHAISPHGTR